MARYRRSVTTSAPSGGVAPSPGIAPGLAGIGDGLLRVGDALANAASAKSREQIASQRGVEAEERKRQKVSDQKAGSAAAAEKVRLVRTENGSLQNMDFSFLKNPNEKQSLEYQLSQERGVQREVSNEVSTKLQRLRIDANGDFATFEEQAGELLKGYFKPGTFPDLQADMAQQLNDHSTAMRGEAHDQEVERDKVSFQSTVSDITEDIMTAASNGDTDRVSSLRERFADEVASLSGGNIERFYPPEIRAKLVQQLDQQVAVGAAVHSLEGISAEQDSPALAMREFIDGTLDKMDFSSTRERQTFTRYLNNHAQNLLADKSLMLSQEKAASEAVYTDVQNLDNQFRQQHLTNGALPPPSAILGMLQAASQEGVTNADQSRIQALATRWQSLAAKQNKPSKMTEQKRLELATLPLVSSILDGTNAASNMIDEKERKAADRNADFLANKSGIAFAQVMAMPTNTAEEVQEFTELAERSANFYAGMVNAKGGTISKTVLNGLAVGAQGQSRAAAETSMLLYNKLSDQGLTGDIPSELAVRLETARTLTLGGTELTAAFKRVTDQAGSPAHINNTVRRSQAAGAEPFSDDALDRFNAALELSSQGRGIHFDANDSFYEFGDPEAQKSRIERGVVATFFSSAPEGIRNFLAPESSIDTARILNGRIGAEIESKAIGHAYRYGGDMEAARRVAAAEVGKTKTVSRIGTLGSEMDLIDNGAAIEYVYDPRHMRYQSGGQLLSYGDLPVQQQAVADLLFDKQGQWASYALTTYMRGRLNEGTVSQFEEQNAIDMMRNNAVSMRAVRSNQPAIFDFETNSFTGNRKVELSYESADGALMIERLDAMPIPQAALAAKMASERMADGLEAHQGPFVENIYDLALTNETLNPLRPDYEVELLDLMGAYD
ncbi:MAG: hypothetical protein JKY34_08795 [Kordiimonadaceae bacterium]|nr:hypothetical protein [Kordiimonadaceae bacterium]